LNADIREEREHVVNIRLLNVLVRHSGGGRAEFSAETRPGLRVRDLMADEGVEERAVQIVIVNGRLGTLDTVLANGDQVMLSPMVAGG
jgi:molybdopterin converting factor small subunit